MVFILEVFSQTGLEFLSSGLVGWLLKAGGLLKGSRLGIIDDRMRKPAPGRKHDFCSKQNCGGIVLLAV